MSVYRYPGPSPFSSAQKDLYHGRSDDVDQLFESVLLNNCTVLLGRSGVGKTSLINAGLLPRLEHDITRVESDQRHFKIVKVRAFSYSPERNVTLSQQIKDCFIRDLGELSQEAKELLNDVPLKNREALGFLLKQYQLDAWLQNRRDIILVVFDQLEELFSYPAEQVEQMEREWSEVVSPNMPDSIRFFIEKQKATNPKFLTEAESAILEVPVLVKMMLAIRSDKLSLLIRMRKAIPDVLSHPYELRPFTREQAVRAITRPAAATDTGFTVAPFSYSEEALNIICHRLETLPNHDPEHSFERQKIEPLTIQLVCRYIERKIAPDDADRVISANEFDINWILSDYYKEAVESLQLDAATQDQLMQVIEEEMIYEQDRRRLAQYEEHLVQRFNLSRDILDRLVEHGIFRRIFSTGTKPTYELAHDWLVDAVVDVKRERRKSAENVDASNDEALGTLNEQIAKSPKDYTLYQQRAAYYDARKEYEMAADDYSYAMQLKGGRQTDTDLLLLRAKSFHMSGRRELAINDYEKVLEVEADNYLAHYNLGVMHYELKNPGLAKTYFSNCVGYAPDYVNAINYLGVIALEDGDLDEAENVFERILDMEPEYKYALVNLGAIAQRQKQNEKALHFYTRAIKADNQYAYAYYLFGNASEAVPDLNTARLNYSKATTLQPDATLYRYNLARMHYELGDYANALAEINKVVQQDDKYTEAWYVQSLIASQMHQHELALRSIKRYLSVESTPEGLHQLGIVHYNSKRYKEAITVFEEALPQVKRQDETLQYIGLCYDQLGDKEMALKYLEKAKGINPSNHYVYFNMGRILYYMNSFEAANDTLLKCLNIKPDHYDSMNYLGLIRRKLGDTPGAEHWYTKAIETNSQVYYPFYNYGILCYEDQRYEEASNYFTRSLAVHGNDPDALNYMGLLAELDKAYETAMSYYEQAISVDSKYDLGRYNLAVVLYNMQRYKEAEQYFWNLIEKEYMPGDCFNYLGAIANGLADYPLSETYFYRSLQAQPDNEYARFNLAEAQYLQEKYKDALANFEKFLERFPTDEEALDYKTKCNEALQA